MIQAATTYHRTAMMLVKTRIPHETELPSVIQVPYSSTFVKRLPQFMCALRLRAMGFFFKFKCPKLGCALDSMAH